MVTRDIYICSNRLRALWVMPVCLVMSVSRIRAPNSKTEKRTKTKISVDVPE